MFKIVTFTDVHLADKGPSSRIDDYREAILDKLSQISKICEDNKADIAVCAGDLFHYKAPTKNSHYLVSRTMEIFKNFPCPVYSIYGNHDISQDNISTLPKQPFYVLLKSGCLHYLEDEFFDNGKIRLFGMDYLKDPDYVDFNKKRLTEEVQMCVAHVNASSKFDDLFGERVYKYQDLSKCSPDIFLFGHYHPDQGIEKHNSKYFINVGSLSRGSLKKDELERTPNCSLITIDDSYNITCEKIPLKVEPSDKIFDLEKKNKEEVEQKEIENFINEMKSKIVSDSDTDVWQEVMSKLNFEKTIQDKAKDYLEKASSNG